MAGKTANNYYKQNQVSLQINENGFLPPQALDLEEAVLGALLLEKEAVIEVLDLLQPESFYKEAHQLIFKAIVDLSNSFQGIDILTVAEQLKRNGTLEGAGGAVFLAQLSSRVHSAVHVEFHARIVAQKYIQRQLIRASTEIQEKAYDPNTDVDDLLDFSEKKLFDIGQGNIKKDAAKIEDIIRMSVKNMEEAGKREDGLSGVPCGFSELDRMTNGWQPSDLVIIAARPSMGKTAFVLSMARNIAVNHNRGVVVFSLEMASIQLVNRLIVGETELDSAKIRTGKLSDDDWRQFDQKIVNLEKAPIFIDDTPAISVFELRAKLRRLMMQNTIDLIIVDYLQLMTGPPDVRGNREQEISHISRGLKAIAKELNIPVLALSQLNRSVEMRTGDKRPQLSDLRESGAIEQDADIVLFIHRPERYGITEDSEGNSTAGLAEIIVAKHRNGAIGDVRLRFIADQAKFADFDEIGLSHLDDNEPVSIPGGVVSYTSKMNSNFDTGISNNKGFGDDFYNPNKSGGSSPF